MKRLALMPGDGIGEEVMDSAQAVLACLRDKFDLALEWERLPWPSTRWHHEHNEMMPADALDQLRNYDALLLGALGDPGPSSDKSRYRLPDGISLSPLLQFRKGLDLWACERPARLLDGAPQYLADARAKDVDMLVIRENSEGEYVNQGGRLHPGTAMEVATQLEVFTRAATERLIRHGFRRAQERLQQRREQGRERQYLCDWADAREAQVCLITKRNALPAWGEMYTEVFELVAREFPDIGVHHELVDAACMKFVQSPWQFDVVVASNLHGDILTDLAAVLAGGLGVAPSCNINPDDRRLPALFEPTHGSAPDIAGQGIANPSAMLLTTAMMLEWLGERPASEALRQAVAKDLVNSKDKPSRSTTQITEAITACLPD
ncbi:isocitrate/isopropylmalate dehydrogenase family protein [Marinimicrobium sp. ABcell2]|uniref:isocitrate/isopropylmalate dehydrogenase family protein n=1 Tax=Marinimicrobium sp. ABcell2 TaxID=3069751 RepID=UPI0027B1D4A4|nr:isocitrate/isopropylmalate dehydrogenase family protein [Marinimicrobium sp. ABcell2]MDQ2075625.1 isocitrate/isopropylmalate dehydrogenase family protein [Marinimicrobium sp. ABcell2]